MHSGSVGQDPKRKETSGIPPFGRFQTADITDVARVMKEIFSENCSSKTKIGDSSRIEGRNAPSVPVPSKMLVEMSKDQSSGDKMHATKPTLEAAPLVMGISNDNSRQSGSGVGVKMEEDNATALGKAPISKSDASEVECKTSDGSAENGADSIQASSKNSIMGSNMEVTCTAPLTAGKKKNVPSERPALDGLTGPCTGASGNEVGSSVVPQGTGKHVGITENNFRNEMELSSKWSPRSPHDVSSIECPKISTKVDAAGDPCSVTPSVSGVTECPEKDSGKSSCIKADGVGDLRESVPISVSHLSATVESPGVTQNNSGDKIQLSLKDSLEPHYIGIRSLEGPTVSRMSDGLGDHPAPVTVSISGSQDHSGNVDLGGGISGRSDVCATEVEATEFAGEAIGEGPEVSGKANNLGAGLVLGDVVSGCNAATLHEVPSNQDKLEGSSNEHGSKSDPMSEVLPSVTLGATNLELVPKDCGRVQLPPIVTCTEGNLVEVCSMEVEPSEIQVPAPNNSVATSANVQDAAENDDRMQLPLGAGSSEGNHVEVCNVEGKTSSSNLMISESSSIGKNSSRIEVQPGLERREGEYVEVCNMEAQASLPKDIAAESANTKPILEDHVGTFLKSRVENTKGDSEDGCNMQINPPVSQVT